MEQKEKKKSERNKETVTSRDRKKEKKVAREREIGRQREREGKKMAKER